MAFGAMFTPHDLDVIARVMVRAAHTEKDMLKRRAIIGVITKLQSSMKSRRTRAKNRAVKAWRSKRLQVDPRQVGEGPPQGIPEGDRPGEARS
jgi:hypothetical protein